jgi:sigma-E factor negative regulatory protein RseC
MNKYVEITHEGIVQETDGNSVTVLLSPLTACKGCYAEKSCNIAGNDFKLINVHGAYNVKTGEKVIVSMKRSMGYSALFLGYLSPLLLVVMVLIVLISFSVNELISGLLSIAILIPYYIILFVFRKLINKKFSFTINT